MAEPFVYHFEHEHPENEEAATRERFEGRPVLGELVDSAKTSVEAMEEFAMLPERNQDLILKMTEFALGRANRIHDLGRGWKQNHWGLYIIGSRARGDEKPDSDLDLLSVGTFYHNQGFMDPHGSDPGVFEGFDVEVPDTLPDEYNVGYVHRKYLMRATSKVEGVLPVDLNVVDLTFVLRPTLDNFKKTMDVDVGTRIELPRVPLFEVQVARDQSLV